MSEDVLDTIFNMVWNDDEHPPIVKFHTPLVLKALALIEQLELGDTCVHIGDTYTNIIAFNSVVRIIFTGATTIERGIEELPRQENGLVSIVGGHFSWLFGDVGDIEGPVVMKKSLVPFGDGYVEGYVFRYGDGVWRFVEFDPGYVEMFGPWEIEADNIELAIPSKRRDEIVETLKAYAATPVSKIYIDKIADLSRSLNLDLDLCRAPNFRIRLSDGKKLQYGDMLILGTGVGEDFLVVVLNDIWLDED